jgi:hypothetical protein
MSSYAGEYPGLNGSNSSSSNNSRDDFVEFNDEFGGDSDIEEGLD